MRTVLGACDPSSDRPAAATRFVFHDDALELRWAHCSSTADFLAEVFGGVVGRAGGDVTDARHSISYLANELLETAGKFRAPGDVEVEAAVGEDGFALWLANTVTGETAERFRTLLEEIVAGDPGDLLIARIEANASDDGDGGSGLGILTLMNDYGVRMGWSFEAAADGSLRLETLAFVALP